MLKYLKYIYIYCSKELKVNRNVLWLSVQCPFLLTLGVQRAVSCIVTREELMLAPEVTV